MYIYIGVWFSKVLRYKPARRQRTDRRLALNIIGASGKQQQMHGISKVQPCYRESGFFVPT